MSSAAQNTAQTAVSAPMRIAAPDSAEEREADRIADTILRGGMVSPGAPRDAGNGVGKGGRGSAVIHRQCASCAAGGPPCASCAADNEDAALLFRDPSGAVPVGDAGASAALRAISGGGRPLPHDTRAYFEPRFGADLGGVRIHTDPRAGTAARGINARAFAHRTDIAFAPGAFQPHSPSGKRLIAHELAHVQAGHVQSGGLYRDGGPGANEPVPETAFETEAQEEPMSRAEEIELSQNSPGGVRGSLQPFHFVLDNFAIDSAELKDEHTAALEELSRLLTRAERGALRLVIAGHADATGADRYNRRLSRRRAMTVRRALRSVTQNVQVAGLGESMLAIDEDSVLARSDNRRVEIYLLPGFRPPGQRIDPEPEPDPEVDDIDDTDDTTHDPPPQTDDDTEIDPPPDPEDDWFCVEHPVLCAALGGAGLALGALVYFCMTNPMACIPGGGPPGTDPPERERRRRPRACVDYVDLPSGILRVEGFDSAYGYHHLVQPFRMRIGFRNDPETGCDCSCGEYLQTVSGTFEENEGAGWVTMRPPLTAEGVPVHPRDLKEDARHNRLPYGHRFSSPLRTLPRAPEDFDQFLPDMEDGCAYSGRDAPGIQLEPPSPPPGTQYRFELAFEGVPVDGCNGRVPLLGHKHNWRVAGHGEFPEPPEEEPPERDPPETHPPEVVQPDPPETQAPPPRTRGPSIGPAPENSRRHRIAPTGFCLNDNLACATLDFILDRHSLLVGDEYDRAIAIEYRALRTRCAIFRPRATPLNPGAAANWDRWTRGQASQRVQAFLNFGYDVRSRDFGSMCRWR